MAGAGQMRCVGDEAGRSWADWNSQLAPTDPAESPAGPPNEATES